MLNKICFFLLVLLVGSCQNTQPQKATSTNSSGDLKSRQVIEDAIRIHGGSNYQVHDIEFDFRERHYRSLRENGHYQYERIFTDSTGQKIRDVLTNDSFVRYVNGSQAEITDERKKAYSSSVNSVIYFALLPYFLKDPAVHSEYVGEVSIHGEPYHKVQITFQQEGGGKDFEDQFLYWFHRDQLTMDYLAYNYKTDGGGARFREAINPRVVNGIRFADYVNYKPVEETLYIMNFDSLFEAGNLDSLSLIATENIEVK